MHQTYINPTINSDHQITVKADVIGGTNTTSGHSVTKSAAVSMILIAILILE